MTKAPTRLICGGCGAEVPPETPVAWACPAATPGDDTVGGEVVDGCVGQQPVLDEGSLVAQQLNSPPDGQFAGGRRPFPVLLGTTQP